MATLLRRLKMAWDNEEHDAYFDLLMANERRPWVRRVVSPGRLFLETALNILRWRLRMQVCAILGHDKQDEGFAGPDSGYIGWTCKRCGFSVGEYLY